jgi:leucyl aminopeptidase
MLKDRTARGIRALTQQQWAALITRLLEREYDAESDRAYDLAAARETRQRFTRLLIDLIANVLQPANYTERMDELAYNNGFDQRLLKLSTKTLLEKQFPGREAMMKRLNPEYVTRQEIAE